MTSDATRVRVLRADAMLLLLAVIWGVGFIAQKRAMDDIGPLTFVTVRLLLGAICLTPLLIFVRGSGQTIKSSRRTRWLMLAGLTLTLFLGTWLQQLGLVTTEAGTAGFITGLYVVFTPLLGLLIGYRVRLMTWIASIIAVAGLFLLTVAGRPDLNIGDLMVLLSAIAWGGQLLFMGWLAPRMHPLVLTVTHLGGAGLLALVVTPFFESVTLAGLLAAKWNILFSALLATSLAFLLQAWAQRDAPPAHAAILISLEAVFAVLFGWWLLSESLSNTQIIGCGVMLTAILMAQIKPPRQAFCAQDDDTPIPPRP